MRDRESVALDVAPRCRAGLGVRAGDGEAELTGAIEPRADERALGAATTKPGAHAAAHDEGDSVGVTNAGAPDRLVPEPREVWLVTFGERRGGGEPHRGPPGVLPFEHARERDTGVELFLPRLHPAGHDALRGGGKGRLRPQPRPKQPPPP